MPRERLAAEALDRQALTWPEDKDPLEIVLRRTPRCCNTIAMGGESTSACSTGFSAD